MSHYVLFFRGGSSRGLPAAEVQADLQKWKAWIGKLGESVKAFEPFGTTGKVVTGAKKSVTDGAYGNGKDQVIGMLLVKAASVDAALEMARSCPVLEREGTVEVRPIDPMADVELDDVEVLEPKAFA